MSQRKKNLEARSNKHFEARLQEFIQFKKDSGRWPDEHSIDKEERSLGMWVRKAKNDYNNGTLNKTRETAFIKLAFTLNVFEEEWNRKFEALKIFIVINRRLPSKREELYNFSGYNHRKFHLFDKERKKLLKSIGFTKLWDKKDIDVVWEKKFNDLVKFYRKHQRFPYRRENSSLGPWVTDQRRHLKNGKLSTKQKSMFKKANINLLAGSRIRRFKNAQAWDGNYDLVVSFIKKKGRMPKHTQKPSEERRLYQWIMNQNWPLKKGKLSGEKVEKLKSLLSSCSHAEKGSSAFLKKALGGNTMDMLQSNTNV